MRKMFYFGVVSAFALLAADVALAGAISPALPAHQTEPRALPLHLSAVICGAQGCKPVTRVRRCLPKRTPHGTSTRRVCNF